MIPNEPEALFAFAHLIRSVEEEILNLFARGEVSGTTHTCLGQELSQLAVARALGPNDYLLSNHRNHGHVLGYSGDAAGLIAEVTGRRGGFCEGRGGSQHIAVSRFHSNGVQGGMTGIAVGLALAERTKGCDAVVTAVIGDGTLGQGIVYEAMNLAGIWSLPVLFVVEHNGVAQTTDTSTTISGDIAKRGEAFGLDCWSFDDADPTLFDDVERVVAAVRKKKRPGMMILRTGRLGPHSKGDDLREKAEMDRLHARDPLLVLRSKLAPGAAERIEKSNAEFLRGVVEEVLLRPPSTPRVTDAGASFQFKPDFRAKGKTVRDSINASLRRLLTDDERVVLLGEDLHDPYGGAFKVTAGLSTDFPGRVISTPISEAVITGATTGLALGGRLPVMEVMFADFMSLCVDQLLNHAAKFPDLKGGEAVPMVVRTPSGGRRGYGPTHSQSTESLIASIPGLTIVSSTNRIDPGALLEGAVRNHIGPLIFFEHKLLYAAPVDAADYEILPAASDAPLEQLFPTVVRARSNPDLVILTFGGMLAEVEQAADRLEDEDELSVEIVVPTLLSPLPSRTLADRVARARRLLVVEEGPRGHGIGAEIVSRMAERGAMDRVMIVAMEGALIPAARALETEVIPSASRIIASALELF